METVYKDKAKKEIVSSFLNSIKPWRKKYYYWLICDFSLILRNETKILECGDDFLTYFKNRRKKELNTFITALLNSESTPKIPIHTEILMEQYWENFKFANKKETRYLVTANMSAGKSTLINAVTGKRLTRTAQESCTASICYLFNKPFEDNAIHLSASPLNLRASYNDLISVDSSAISSVATHFRTSLRPGRVCVIDTPGVNSVMNRSHKEITREALKNEAYDKLIFVLNANKLGTDEEREHILWVANNTPKDKVIFVLNKLDTFKRSDDSIEESIENVKQDLLEVGYHNPLVCPLSSYFALLVKLKANGDELSEDEKDEYELYKKKFSKKEYDLSRYYGNVDYNESDSELISMSKKCGLYGLEQLLFKGDTK